MTLFVDLSDLSVSEETCHYLFISVDGTDLKLSETQRKQTKDKKETRQICDIY